MTSLLDAVSVVVGAVVLAGWSWRADWLGIVRMILMSLGGLVVIAIVLIVAVAIISGIVGMVGGVKGTDDQRPKTDGQDPGR